MTLKAVVFATLKYRDRKKNVAHLYKIMKPEPLRLRTIGKNYSMSQVPTQLLILSKCSFISFKDILTYNIIIIIIIIICLFVSNTNRLHGYST